MLEAACVLLYGPCRLVASIIYVLTHLKRITKRGGLLSSMLCERHRNQDESRKKVHWIADSTHGFKVLNVILNTRKAKAASGRLSLEWGYNQTCHYCQNLRAAIPKLHAKFHQNLWCSFGEKCGQDNDIV